jgi:hypothetical protein
MKAAAVAFAGLLPRRVLLNAAAEAQTLLPKGNCH